MVLRAKPGRLRETEWWEYLVRFAFGGAVTAIAGWIASRYGPVVGGLFLAFPGIFPSSITLVERHERKKKEQRGLQGERRAREVSSVVAAGSALGSVGLAGFALLAWLLLPRLGTAAALALATLTWICVSVLAWLARRRL